MRQDIKIATCPGCGQTARIYHLMTEEARPRFCMDCLKAPMAKLRGIIDGQLDLERPNLEAHASNRRVPLLAV